MSAEATGSADYPKPDPTELALAIAIGNAVRTLTDDATFLLARRAIDALRSLPVEQRMEAMGLTAATLFRAGAPTGEYLVRDPTAYVPPPVDNPCRVCSQEVDQGYGEKQGRSGWVHWDCLEIEL